MERKIKIILILVVVAVLAYGVYQILGPYLWMRETQEELQTETEKDVQQQMKENYQVIGIDSVACDSNEVYVRHTGNKYTIPVDKIKVYKNGAKESVTWYDENKEISELEPNEVVVVKIELSAGDKVKIEAPGNEDSGTC